MEVSFLRSINIPENNVCFFRNFNQISNFTVWYVDNLLFQSLRIQMAVVLEIYINKEYIAYFHIQFHVIMLFM